MTEVHPDAGTPSVTPVHARPSTLRMTRGVPDPATATYPPVPCVTLCHGDDSPATVRAVNVVAGWSSLILNV